jgi:ferritin
MLKENVSKALSEQVNAEYYSAYLYLAMSAYADNAGYKGIANWFFVQAKEEMDHGTRILKYLLERGAAPVFSDVKAPQTSFSGVRDLFEKALAHERHVTGLVNKIADLAAAEKDHATYSFISWFVDEQVEEESAAEDLAVKTGLIGDNYGPLFQLDAVLGARTFKED